MPNHDTRGGLLNWKCYLNIDELRLTDPKSHPSVLDLRSSAQGVNQYEAGTELQLVKCIKK